MPKRISNPKHPRDINQIAHQLLELSTSERPDLLEPTLSPAALTSLVMAEMGRKGGKIGGKRRLQTMTSEERITIAKHAANSRWKKTKDS